MAKSKKDKSSPKNDNGPESKNDKTDQIGPFNVGDFGGLPLLAYSTAKGEFVNAVGEPVFACVPRLFFGGRQGANQRADVIRTLRPYIGQSGFFKSGVTHEGWFVDFMSILLGNDTFGVRAEYRSKGGDWPPLPGCDKSPTPRELATWALHFNPKTPGDGAAPTLARLAHYICSEATKYFKYCGGLLGNTREDKGAGRSFGLYATCNGVLVCHHGLPKRRIPFTTGMGNALFDKALPEGLGYPKTKTA